MMHERVRRRLESLEEAHRLASGPPQIVNIHFINPDGSEVAPMVATGRNFECFRQEGESADDFKCRAHAECRAADPRPPVQI